MRQKKLPAWFDPAKFWASRAFMLKLGWRPPGCEICGDSESEITLVWYEDEPLDRESKNVWICADCLEKHGKPRGSGWTGSPTEELKP